MDFSKEYIGMCKKAEEIQRERTKKDDWEDGDFIILRENIQRNSDSPIVHSYNFGLFDEYFMRFWESPNIWLPRIDQLIGLIEYKYGIARIIIELSVSIKEHFDLIRYGDTLEKVFLLYYMRVKHDKRWDGKEWTSTQNNYLEGK